MHAEFRIAVHADGHITFSMPACYGGPVNLVRPWTDAEVAADPGLDDNWSGGGCAILDRRYASNGPALARRAEDEVDWLRNRLQKLVGG